MFVVAAVVIGGAFSAAIAFPSWRDPINWWMGSLTGGASILLYLVLQASQNRAAAAAQAKADELLRAIPAAREDLIGAEILPEDEIERLRPIRGAAPQSGG